MTFTGFSLPKRSNDNILQKNRAAAAVREEQKVERITPMRERGTDIFDFLKDHGVQKVCFPLIKTRGNGNTFPHGPLQKKKKTGGEEMILLEHLLRGDIKLLPG